MHLMYLIWLIVDDRNKEIKIILDGGVIKTGRMPKDYKEPFILELNPPLWTATVRIEVVSGYNNIKEKNTNGFNQIQLFAATTSEDLPTSKGMVGLNLYNSSQ